MAKIGKTVAIKPPPGAGKPPPHLQDQGHLHASHLASERAAADAGGAEHDQLQGQGDDQKLPDAPTAKYKHADD